jgi:hypothetical protein
MFGMLGMSFLRAAQLVRDNQSNGFKGVQPIRQR